MRLAGKPLWRSFESGTQRNVPVLWNVVGWPNTYVIDQDRVIRHANLRGKKLDELLEEMVAAVVKDQKESVQP